MRRNYDRQIILHLGVDDNRTPKVKWDRSQHVNLNTNIDLTNQAEKQERRIAVRALTNQSRVYVVGHGVQGEQDKIYKSKTEGVSYRDIVKYIGDNAPDASLRLANAERVLRISMVVCMAAASEIPDKLHRELRANYGIFSEVVARHDEVWVNGEYGIKYAVNHKTHLRLPGRAPKVLIRFQGDKQIREGVSVDEYEPIAWNFEATTAMQLLQCDEVAKALKKNQSNIDLYHVRVANERLLDALRGAKLKIPATLENKKLLSEIDNLIASYQLL